MEEELKTIETVDTSPFKHLVMTLGELPTSFVDSMTYYECLAWLVNFIQNTVIPTVNNNAEAVEELQTAFTTLKNYVDTYFDNLDVQDEINNKLDQMAEDGTLEEIMASYIQTKVAWTFDTVADMKASTNLINGSYARTLGYHAINDGGGAIYKVMNTEPNSYYETYGNLYLMLITGSAVNPEMFGAYCDSDFHGTTGHDDTVALQNAIDSGKNIVSYKKGFYKTTDSLIIKTFTNRTLELHAGIRCEAVDKYAIVFDGTGRVSECNINFDDIVARYGCIAFYPNSQNTGAVVTMKMTARILYADTAECIYVENDGWFNENIFRDINFQHGTHAFKCIFKSTTNQKDLGRLTFEHCHFEGITNGVLIDVNGNENQVSGLVFNDCRMVESPSGFLCRVLVHETVDSPSMSSVLILNDISNLRTKFTGNVLYISPTGFMQDFINERRTRGSNPTVFYGENSIPLHLSPCSPTSNIGNISTDSATRTVVDATTSTVIPQLRGSSSDTNYLEVNLIPLNFYYFATYQIKAWKGTYNIKFNTYNNQSITQTFTFNDDHEVKMLFIDYRGNRMFYY